MGLLFVLSVSAIISGAFAEGESETPPTAAVGPSEVPKIVPKSPKHESTGPLITGKERVPKKKGKRREQKETEGSEAPGRFEADTILKSPYTVDGQPLEVDPD